jgi:N-acetyl-gamma-glutamyl-phosphate reductase
VSQVAAVVGASGYTGGELLRLLTSHPGLAVGPVFGASSAGRRLGEVHRQLVSTADLTIRSVAELEGGPERALDGVDVVFLAMPHGHSGAMAKAILAAMPTRHPVIVDLGADHRLADPGDWATYYGATTDAHVGPWTYGLPELADSRSAIGRSRLIANPGCYPTGVALALSPLLAAGIAAPHDVVVVAASGTTGAGRSTASHLSGSEVMGSLAAYKAGGEHQHTPEMSQSLTRAAGTTVPVSFTPILAPMPRGILATSSAPVAPGVSGQTVREVLATAYRDEAFVSLLPEGSWPRTSDVLGSNSVHIQAAVDAVAGRVVVVTAIDNLVKGAAGQAIQNANLALGLDEANGLTADGIAP